MFFFIFYVLILNVFILCRIPKFDSFAIWCLSKVESFDLQPMVSIFMPLFFFLSYFVLLLYHEIGCIVFSKGEHKTSEISFTTFHPVKNDTLLWLRGQDRFPVNANSAFVSSSTIHKSFFKKLLPNS